MSTIETSEALDALPPEVAVYPGTDANDQHVYIRDTTEGCWVAYVRADCVGVEEIPLPAYVPSQTAADQPTTEPSKDDLLDTQAGLALAHQAWYEGFAAYRLATQEHESTGKWHTPSNPYFSALVHAPAPQPAADTERRSDCGNPEPHEPHNFRNGGPEDGDYCHGLLDPHEETPGTPVALLLAEPFRGSSDRHQRAMVVLADEVQRLRALVPAADTEREVQWGVQTPSGGVLDYDYDDQDEAVEAQGVLGEGFTVIHCTATTTRTPWEEV